MALSIVTGSRLNADLSLEFLCQHTKGGRKRSSAEWYPSFNLSASLGPILAYLTTLPTTTLDVFLHCNDADIKTLIRLARNQVDRLEREKVATKSETKPVMEKLQLRIAWKFKLINISALRHESIESIKLQIEKLEGIPPNEQILFLFDRTLEGDSTLAQNHISGSDPASTLLRLERTGRSEYRIYVFEFHPGGNLISLWVSEHDTIGIVKSKVRDKVDIPTDLQRLTLDQERLEDRRTLADYCICPGSTLNLTIRSRHEIRSGLR